MLSEVSVPVKGLGILLILHHCLEIGEFHDSGLVVLDKVCKVGIATDDVVGTNGLGQREKVEVLGVADGCGRNLGIDNDELAECIDITFMLYLAYLTALTSSMISSSLMAGFAGRLLTKRSSSCSRVSACQPNLRMSSRKSDQSTAGTFT